MMPSRSWWVAVAISVEDADRLMVGHLMLDSRNKGFFIRQKLQVGCVSCTA